MTWRVATNASVVVSCGLSAGAVCARGLSISAGHAQAFPVRAAVG